MILSAQSIRKRDIFRPFFEQSKAFGMTYGLGPAGYDVRVSEEFILGPGEFRLASTVEYFNMPLDLQGVVHDKSTLARLGLALQNTIIDPGWYGFLTLEMHNQATYPLEIKSGMPIACVVLHKLDEATEKPYEGKYQAAPMGVTKAILVP